MASAPARRGAVAVVLSAVLVVITSFVYLLARSVLKSFADEDLDFDQNIDEESCIVSSRMEGRNSNGDRIIHYGRAFISSELTECYFNGTPEAEWDILMFTFGGFDFIVRCHLETNHDQDVSIVCCPQQFELDILD